MTKIRVSSGSIWLLLLLQVGAFINIHLCLSQDTPLPRVYDEVERAILFHDRFESDFFDPGEVEFMDSSWNNTSRYSFYTHNETRIAMAREEASSREDVGVATTASAITYPDFKPSADGCNWVSVASDLSVLGMMEWSRARSRGGSFDVQILAVDSCIGNCVLYLRHQTFDICTVDWWKQKAEILIRNDVNTPTQHSFKVLVQIDLRHLDVVAEGVYFPATGRMHLVGCYPDVSALISFLDYESSLIQDHNNFTSRRLSVPLPPAVPYTFPAGGSDALALLNSTSLICDISATVQYPPLNLLWNWNRVAKLELRSTRPKDDPLYFKPVERGAFFPYRSRYSQDSVDSQRRLETAGRTLLLVLGLICIGLQIEHGRHNEESLPFVSLVMLGIQLANHLSQTSIFKDLQIAGYHHHDVLKTSNGEMHHYYTTMAWSVHLPYQGMTMAAIFMYVWIFHKVGDRRRIMQLRVRRQRLGAEDAPSDWLVIFKSCTVFFFITFLGFNAIRRDDRYSYFGNYSGMAGDDQWQYTDDRSPFMPLEFFQLLNAHWGVINKMTRLIVSFFLVPQLLGNQEWHVQGRPLSAWFYFGITFLQSLPHVFSIAKHFQLLPIFPLYDPYLDSTFGTFQDQTPWWRIGVVASSMMLAFNVHLQVGRSDVSKRQSVTKTPADEHRSQALL